MKNSNIAFREWLDRVNTGERLPRGSFFKRRQQQMRLLAHLLRGSHDLAWGHLHDAHGHYLDITGADPLRKFHTTHPEELAEDKVTYSYLIKQDCAGLPIYHAEECALFMADTWKHNYSTALAFSCLYSPN